jgi:tetratricopeptide (TPR) repeat protein
MAGIFAAIALGGLGVRWQLGSMLAELTSPSDPAAKNISEVARGLAPDDPLAMWLFANAHRDLFKPDSIEPSITGFENVVRSSPNDYRWWIELGRVEEQAERRDRAEVAFRRAIELAPSYAYPRWQYGNFLLRSGRPDEAFLEFRKTAENNYTYREQVFSLAWDYFDHDPARVEALAADTADSRASLALFYAARGQAEASLRVWNMLSDEQKSQNPQIARTIAQALTEKKFFRQGLEFSRQVGIDPEAQFEAVTNGDFERSFGNPDDNYYGWNIERGNKNLDISADSSVKHSGNRSLRVNFRTFVNPSLANPWQVLAVQPGGDYVLRFWVRTENLRSAGMPIVEVLETSEYHLLAASPAMATGTNDWQETVLEFKAAENADGVVVRLSRSYCGEACPIVGMLWLDDFTLVKK